VPFQRRSRGDRPCARRSSSNRSNLSCYCLTFEEGTPLHRRLKKGCSPAVDGDAQSDLMEMCQSELTGAGFIATRFRVGAGLRSSRSTTSRTGSADPVYGAGCGAHSYGTIRSFVATLVELGAPQDYISSELRRGCETLDPRRTAAERIMLGLRTVDGLEVPRWFRDRNSLNLAAAGLVTPDGAPMSADTTGLALHNQVALAVL